MTQPLVWKLSVSAKPIGIGSQVRFEDNPAGVPYIVFDASPKAPPGFGLKVYKSGTSYLIQRRVGDQVIKAKAWTSRTFLWPRHAQRLASAWKKCASHGKVCSDHLRLAEASAGTIH